MHLHHSQTSTSNTFSRFFYYFFPPFPAALRRASIRSQRRGSCVKPKTFSLTTHVCSLLYNHHMVKVSNRFCLYVFHNFIYSAVGSFTSVHKAVPTIIDNGVPPSDRLSAPLRRASSFDTFESLSRALTASITYYTDMLSLILLYHLLF